jgi:SNF2 family DNA or RNA helicase
VVCELTPYPYQEEGSNRIRKDKRVLVADPMGTGKTMQLILGNAHHKRILIVCPPTLKYVWQKEIAKWTGEESLIINGAKDASKVCSHTKWLIVNYECIRLKSVNISGRGGLVPSTAAGKVVFAWKPNSVIFDEADTLSNPKAAWSVGAMHLAKNTECVYPATGTPWLIGVEDLWMMLHLVAPQEYPSRWKFLIKHANAHQGKWGWVWNEKATDPTALAREIAPYFMRREIEDIGLQLPPKLPTQTINLPATPEQERLFKEIKEEMVAEINAGGDEFMLVQTMLTKIGRLRQVSIDPRLVGSDKPGAKIAECVRRVRGLPGKSVVFSCFSGAANLMSEELDKAGVKHVLMTGDTPQDVRGDLVKMYQEDDEVRAFVTTIKAGGPGITLTSGCETHFLDRHWVPSRNAQAEHRVDRIGQTKPVRVHNYITEESVDQYVYDISERREQDKKEFMEALKRFLK